MFDICLINPPHPYLVSPNAQCSLGILYVASAARDAGYSVSVFNGSHLKVESIEELPDACVYGITATAVDINSVNALVSKILLKFADSKVIVGGPASLSPEYIIPGVSVVKGYGESVIADIIDDAKRGRLRREYSGCMTDVDAIKEPARDLWPRPFGEKIFTDGMSGESAVVTTTRGCPYNCAFCASPSIHNRIVHIRSVDSVVSELEKIVVDYGVNKFRFSDDSFNLSTNRVYDICRGFRNSPYLNDIMWRASVRATPNDRELFFDMKSAGCRDISIGVESADPIVLDVLRKGIVPEDYETALLNARQAGLRTRALCMIATPGERRETKKLNMDFFRRKMFTTLSVTMFAPFPGCAVWNNPDSFGCKILHHDFEQYNVCQHDQFGPRKLIPHVELYDYDYDEFTLSAQEQLAVARETTVLNIG